MPTGVSGFLFSRGHANLYLHIGRGKTGTTAIQRFLSAHREALRAQGLHYVEMNDAARMGHQNFAKSFIHSALLYENAGASALGTPLAVRKYSDADRDRI